jgi:peptidoglycan/LPS O-acetylase OafA/YrhL
MELIAAIVLAGPLGYFCRTRKQGLGLYLVAWGVIFPIQFVVVHHENADDISAVYFIFNAVILAAGIGLNTLGAHVRERRAAPTLEVTR